MSVEIYEDGEGGWLLEVVDEYVREEKEVVLNSGEMLIAWIYIYNRPTGALEEISSGDFLRVNDI
ncbi:MAG: hypothetical protein IH606_19965 [Burkholderiales bacterium]|nr:hypothetical protein [Burkholderiales bacterium]